MNTSPLTDSHLGLDIGKSKIYACLLLSGRQPKRKVVTNNTEGHQALLDWLKRHPVQRLHACQEATSTYGQAIAKRLHEHGYIVSIANPKAVHAYAESRLSRTKTDSVDAHLIALYCRDIKPNRWTPAPAEIETLQELVRRHQALGQMIIQEENRLETASAAMESSIKGHIHFMEQQQQALQSQIDAHIDQHPHLKQQRDLLDSIPGIGSVTASRLLSEIGDWQVFGSARQLAAYAGLTPQEKSSGTSIRGKTRLSKVGNARIRRALFLPALCLLRWQPAIANWRDQLLARGKCRAQVVGAVMHKLIRWVFGVLHSGKPFDPTICFPQPPAQEA